MPQAGLDGVPASPKRLRHGFGVAAVYADAVGAEEQDIARRMWERSGCVPGVPAGSATRPAISARRCKLIVQCNMRPWQPTRLLSWTFPP
jgi:hypothetical protein